jgi:hypothetical protein
MKKIFFLFFFILIVLLFFDNPVYGWLDCPYGKINDPYPGSCFRYVDTNNNKICDHSEPAPQQAKDISSSLPAKQKLANPLFWIIFLTITVYFCHWYLVNKTALSQKNKWFSQSFFRFFWNGVLLITFLITGISGLLLAFGVLNKTLSLWHNYAGLVFIIVGFFHCLAHLSYFKKIFK